MVNVSIVGLEANALKQTIEASYPGLKVVTENPDITIAYGGDGTFLYAEEHAPGTPKALLRSTMLCDSHKRETQQTILGILEKGEYELRQHPKLQIETGSTRLVGAYDVTVAHTRINTTVRMRVTIQNKTYDEEIVGDGILVATPLGSTGYYQSITRSMFASGFGVAFNNSVNTVSHLVTDEDAQVRVHITRGPGVVAADNNETLLPIATGDEIIISRAPETLQLVTFAGPHDQYNFAMNRLPSGVCQLCGVRYVAS